MPLTLGGHLGQYEIIAPLGAGGMGEVYRARDSKLNRDVAIKVLSADFAHDPERLGRMEREAKVLASLNHPNIGSIYGFEDSSAALVMELVEGPTLAELIAKSPLAVEEALPIARQICEALEYAHERGVIHRDLKPANIKITPDGTVKLLDFGLAKALTPDLNSKDVSSSPTLTAMATKAGFILGTAAYMAPEQAKGRAVDRRADIWAFGCVLFEMLTGKMAFAGETVTDILAEVIKSEPDWTKLPSSTPSHIRVLLKRCLQKDPRQRLRDIGDARISIEEVLSGAQDSFPNAGIVHPRARRILPWIAGIAAAAIVGGLLTWKLLDPAPPVTRHFSAITNFAGVQSQPAVSPDGRSVAFVSERDGHSNIYVALTGGGSLVQVTNDANLKVRPSWSPDGATLAYARLNDGGVWDIWQVPALGGASRRIVLNATDPSWSPDGRLLVYENGADKALWVSGPSGENAHQLAHSERIQSVENRDTQPRFSPDGKQVAFASRLNGPYGELCVADVATGKVRILTNDNALALSPAWSADSNSIYFASSRGGTMNIWKIAADGGHLQQITSGQGDDAELDVSADGKKIFFSTWRTNMNVAQLDIGSASPSKLLTSDPARNQVAPVYSPDGKLIAYFSNLKGAEAEAIWIANADGSHPVQLVRDDRIDIFPAWQPDSQGLIYEAEALTHGHPNDEYRTVSISGGAPQTLMKEAPYRFFDVGRDGRILFRSGDQAGSFDPRTGKSQTLGTIKNIWGLSPIRWSPDQRSVAYVTTPAHAGDPDAGVWVTDFTHPPRQVFRGWVDWWVASGPGDELYFVQGKGDLKGVLWKVKWNGQGLQQTSAVIPMNHSYWIDPVQSSQNHFAISPDGRHVAFESQTVLEANIAIIEEK